MTSPLLTLALDLTVTKYWLGEILKSGHVDVLKLGPWSLLAKPDGSTQTFSDISQFWCDTKGIPIFWDFKLADTLDTNANVIRTLPKGGYVTITTALYSTEDLLIMVQLCKECNITPVAVIVTSSTKTSPLLSNASRNNFFLSEFARVTDRNGLKDVVCDGSTLRLVNNTPVKTHVPGIRPEWYAAADNHQHAISPRDAARRGANNIIIGRPVLSQQTLRDILYRLEMARNEIDTA